MAFPRPRTASSLICVLASTALSASSIEAGFASNTAAHPAKTVQSAPQRKGDASRAAIARARRERKSALTQLKVAKEAGRVSVDSSLTANFTTAPDARGIESDIWASEDGTGGITSSHTLRPGYAESKDSTVWRADKPTGKLGRLTRSTRYTDLLKTNDSSDAGYHIRTRIFHRETDAIVTPSGRIKSLSKTSVSLRTSIGAAGSPEETQGELFAARVEDNGTSRSTFVLEPLRSVFSSGVQLTIYIYQAGDKNSPVEDTVVNTGYLKSAALMVQHHRPFLETAFRYLERTGRSVAARAATATLKQLLDAPAK